MDSVSCGVESSHVPVSSLDVIPLNSYDYTPVKQQQKKKNSDSQPGAVAYTYNPSTLGEQDG